MTLTEFQLSQDRAIPPGSISPALQALWFEAKGDWNKAHELAQEEGESAGAWVHAYLHRKEGDIANARYWYARAGKPIFFGPLGDEWLAISEALLANS